MSPSANSGSAARHRSRFTRVAFTLIELLVVLATMAVLAVMLLPALAGTQTQSKATACSARYRQWAASANLYANDNRGWLPTFNPYGGGSFAWDVGTNMLNALLPYGMDVPDYFCPMRPAQWDAANQWVQTHAPPPPPLAIQNINSLRRYFSRNFPGECQINDNYWVPRSNNGGSTTFPVDYSHKPLKPPWASVSNPPTSSIYGWPQRLHDIAVPYVPFVSDAAGSGQSSGLNSPYPASPYITNLAPNTAHFVNGTLIGVNCAYADGHVASHTPDQMRTAYSQGISFWFY